MQAVAALLILGTVSLIGFAVQPSTLRNRSLLAIPLSLTAGTLVAGWLCFVAGLISTSIILPLFTILAVLSLVRAREWARMIFRFCRHLGALARANVIAAAGVAVVVLLAVPQLLLPLCDSDGTAYQVAMPKLYLLSGNIWFVPWTYASALPQTVNMLYLAGFKLAGGETAKFIHFGFFLMTLATLAVIVHRDRATRRAAFIAPLLYAAAPVVLAPAGAAFVEHASAAAIATAALLLFRRAPSWSAGLALGGALAAKMTILPALGGLWLYGVAVSRNRLRDAIVMSAAILIAFAPFGIRNVHYTGDPLFPIGYGLLKKPIAGVSQEGVERTAYYHSKVPGPLGIGWTPDPKTVQGDEVAGLHHAFGFFALALLIRYRWPRRWLAVLLPCLAVALLFRPPTRYLIPMFLPLAALEAEAIARLLRRWSGIAAIVFAAPAAIAAAAFTFNSFGPWQYLRGRIDRETFLATRIPGYRAAKFVNAQPGGGRVMALDFPAPYYFDKPWIAEGMINEPPLQRWLADAQTPDQLLRKLQALEVRYILITPGYGGGTPQSLLPLARNEREANLLAALRRRLTKVATLDGVDVVRVP